VSVVGRRVPCRRGAWSALLSLGAAASLLLVGCARGGPPPALYVLGAMPPAMTATTSEAGLAVVEVTEVKVPDYLDTTDLIVRSFGRLIPSATGRWGERLSVGMTRALAASLAARLPRMVVTTARPAAPARRILVDVEAFEAQSDGSVVLAASWSIASGSSRQTLLAEHSSIAVPLEKRDDAAVVAAMSRAVDELADQIAAGFSRPLSERHEAIGSPIAAVPR
jgi:uncharacterized protein